MLKQITHALFNPFFLKKMLWGTFEICSLLKMHQTTVYITLHFLQPSPGREVNDPTFLEFPRKHEEACRDPKDMMDFWAWGWGVFLPSKRSHGTTSPIRKSHTTQL